MLIWKQEFQKPLKHLPQAPELRREIQIHMANQQASQEGDNFPGPVRKKVRT